MQKEENHLEKLDQKAKHMIVWSNSLKLLIA